MGSSPQNWKKPLSFLSQKISKKQELMNYCPISVLHVSVKIYGRSLYDSMFEFFTENSLISQNQSGIKTGDTCNSYSCQLQIKPTNLLMKLKLNSILRILLSYLTDFLNLRKQRVMLNSWLSSWSNIESGVPQGSFFGPLLFLIYISDLCRRNFTVFCRW